MTYIPYRPCLMIPPTPWWKRLAMRLTLGLYFPEQPENCGECRNCKDAKRILKLYDDMIAEMSRPRCRRCDGHLDSTGCCHNAAPPLEE